MLDFNAIGRNIQKARIKAGMTQEAIAEKLDVTPDYISKVETGAKCLALPTLDKMADVLEVSISYLLTGTDPQKVDYCFKDFYDLIEDWEPETRILLLKTAEVFSDVDKSVKASKKDLKN